MVQAGDVVFKSGRVPDVDERLAGLIGPLASASDVAGNVKVIKLICAVTLNVCVTGTAARIDEPLPGCEAVIEHTPALRRLSVPPGVTVQTKGDGAGGVTA